MRREVASICGYAAAIPAMSALSGWLLEAPLLTTWGSGLNSMKPITVLAVLICVAVVTLGHRLTKYGAAGPGAAVVICGGMVLWQHATGSEVQAFDWFAPKWAVTGANAINFRIAATTATCIFLAGLGCIALALSWPARVLAGLALALLLVDLVGALSWSILPDRWDVGDQSLPSVVAFALIAASFLALSGYQLPQLSLWLTLIGLVVSSLAPALILFAFQTQSEALSRRADVEVKANQVTAQIGRIVEKAIAEKGILLKALAASPDLRTGNFAAFHDYASRVAVYPEGAIVLIDRSMNMVLSTAVSYGTKLPEVVDTVTSMRAFDTGKLEVSDVYISPFSQESVIGVVLPVAGTEYQLRMTITGLALSRLLAEAAQPGWILGIIDSKRVVGARSRDAKRWLGQRVPERIREKTTPVFEAGHGVISVPDIDGRPSYLGFRKTVFGWTAVAVMDEAAVDTFLKRGSGFASKGWVAVAISGLLMATAAALLIGRSLRHLTNAANLIGSGGIPVPISSGIVEIDRVSTALSASAQLRSDTEAIAFQQQLLLQAVFASNPDCMMLADIDRKSIRVNPAFEKVFRYEAGEFVGNSTRSIYADPADWLEVGNRFESDPRAVVAGRYRLVRKNGEEFPALFTAVKLVDDTGAFVAYLSIIRDITIDLQREQALFEKRNLEALGRLSSGIAHDFNNMLTIVSANIQLAELRTDDPECVELINQALHATNMAARLGQRLMRFATRSRLMPVPADLNVLADSALEIVRRTMGAAVIINARFDANPAWVRVDESELENALVNLALNARDAMPEGGRLTVETGNARLESCDPLISAGLTAGDYVYLSVSDTGIGMTDEVKARALEPFFTTKEPGKGTGLGLTTIHSFVAQLGGALRIDSSLSRGTLVKILLPLEDRTKSSDSADASVVSAPSGGGERILLVEDNPFVRESTTKLLQLLGYRVEGAENGTEAIALVESGQKLDLVISDVMMPGALSGLDLARKLADTKPELAVLLYSGNPDAWQDASHSPPEKQIMHKPFTRLQLSTAIDRALNRRQRTSA